MDFEEVSVTIKGFTVKVGRFDWYTYFATAKPDGGEDKGRTKCFASRDVSACRCFVSSVIDEYGGQGEIEFWIIQDKMYPMLDRFITQMNVVKAAKPRPSEDANPANPTHRRAWEEFHP